MTRAVLIACALACSAACSTAAHTRARTEHSARQANAESLAQEGLRRLSQGDSIRAEQYLLLASRAGYPESKLIVPLLEACMGASRLRAALAHALPYLRAHPSAWRVRYLAATIQAALGDVDAAVSELERVVRDHTLDHPEAAEAHYLLGVLQRDTRADDRAALDSFAAYLARAPNGEHAEEARGFLRDHERSTAPTTLTETP